MPKFSYTAVNKENQHLQGSIEAVNETDAQNQLHTMGLTVVEIKVDIDTPSTDDIKKTIFHFSAIDKNKKNISGTIKSLDSQRAYDKLINAYNFTVLTLSSEQDGQLTPIDLHQLKQNPLAPTSKMNNEASQSVQSLELVTKVEHIIIHTEQVLVILKDELKPAAREEIRKHINKLKLIKHSTNQQYIKETAKKLLALLQNEESFLAQEKFQSAKQKCIVTSQSLLHELTKKPSLTTDLKKITQNLAQTLRPSTPKKTFLNQLRTTIADFLEGKNQAQSPELAQLKEQKQSLNSELWHYRKEFWLAKAEQKDTIRGQIEHLKKEKERVLEAIANLNQESKVQQSALTPTYSAQQQVKLLVSFHSFTGWLLTIYLGYYFLSFIFMQSNLMDSSWNFNVFIAPGIKYALISCFLVHASLSLKLNFFRHHRYAGPILTITTLLLIIFSIVNL